MKIPFVDLSTENRSLRDQALAAVARIIDSGQFILGPDVIALEEELVQVVGARHVVGLSSGTDALLAGLMALGICRGDEVVTTPFSFFATAGAIARLGARPVFADIEAGSFNLDPAQALAACGSRTQAIITVHLFGRPAHVPGAPVPVLEDAAQSIGAAPLQGAAGCLSFFPSKNLGAFGDAGALYTNDDGLVDRVRLLRTHGARPKYHHQIVGGNFRLDTLQAAILRVKLPHLGKWNAARRENATRYRLLAAAHRHFPAEVQLPADTPQHIYNQFAIRVPRRDALREHLSRKGVATEVYYPVPFHLQRCFSDLGYAEGAFPEAEAAAREALALPIHAGLNEDEQAYIIESLASFYCS